MTLETEQKHAEVARAEHRARRAVRSCGHPRRTAIETLPTLDAEGAGPFDLVFIDADKTGYPDYWPWALRLSRPGAVIIADNVVRDGKVADAQQLGSERPGRAALPGACRRGAAGDVNGAADGWSEGIRRTLDCDRAMTKAD